MGALFGGPRGGGGEVDRGNAVAVDSADNVVVTGVFQLTANFDPDSYDPIVEHGGGDVFVWKLGPTGLFQWSAKVGGTRCK